MSSIESNTIRRIETRVDGISSIMRFASVVRRRLPRIGLSVTMTALFFSTTAAAQTAETDSAVVEFINNAAPTVLAYLILFGTVIAVGAHVMSGFPKNPETANRLKDWRNRAAMGVLGAPIIALILEQMLSFVPIPWLQQIDLVPLV